MSDKDLVDKSLTMKIRFPHLIVDSLLYEYKILKFEITMRIGLYVSREATGKRVLSKTSFRHAQCSLPTLCFPVLYDLEKFVRKIKTIQSISKFMMDSDREYFKSTISIFFSAKIALLLEILQKIDS